MPLNKVSIEFEGKEYSLETGRFAKQASGSVMVRYGDSMVLVTVTASEKENLEIDYLPLQVEYREKAASAGKIPGGFFKREGKPSDKEVLSARLIDRPIRPMIPKTWRFETQIIASVFSSEPGQDPDTLAAIGASAALMISDIPFKGPISELRVGRIDGQFVVNPTLEQLKTSDIDITVAGTDASIMMVEGESKEISEDDFLAALEFAHEKIKLFNDLQNRLVALAAVPKRAFTELAPPEEIVNFIKNEISGELNDFVNNVTTKTERHEKRKTILKETIEKVTAGFSENEEYAGTNFSKLVEEIVYKLEKNAMRQMILESHKRLDGRNLTEIRPIACEAGVLPRAHGSALFTRGETQSLTTTTLGTKSDEQLIDGLQPVYTNRFLLHYNFPPFCTGEVGRVGGVSRREIGHGNLAERALKQMLPDQADFPYTLRIVSDILESNGSSSMATVCAGCLSMLDAGVPMKKSVAGIAMGLIKEEDKIAVLSDILGDEDFLGDMDFKVAGTSDGITACQMDIKIEGLSLEIMKTALDQAHHGRLHILGKMNECLSEPRAEMSPFAPRFTILKIPQDKIGAVIGPGGENIRSIVRETGADINIDDDGTVMIAATSAESGEEAARRVELCLRNPEEGEVYTGVIKEIREGLGAFVEFLPKRQGLLHISQIAHERTENISDILTVGEKVEVKLLEITPDGKFRLSRKALLERPEGMEETEDRPRRDSRPGYGNDRRDDRDRRGGSGNRDRGRR